MNITDVDDKIIRNAVAQGKSLAEYSNIYTQAFFDDSQLLRLERPEHIARATEHIDEMAEPSPRSATRATPIAARLGLLPHLEIPRNTASCRTTISAA